MATREELEQWAKDAAAAGSWEAASYYNSKVAEMSPSSSSYTPLGDYDAGTLYTQNAPNLSSDQAAYYQQQIQAAGDRYNSAATDAEREAAHADAEYYRSLAGYSGGADGSDYIPLSSGGGSYSGGSSGSFSYPSAPEYASQYTQMIQDARDLILNRDAFSYDPESDPLYQQYKDSYTRSGKLAMQDTLGQVAARTGGLASSYAGSAAQQAYNNYMAALNDKIPELKQLAYSMYTDEGDKMLANLQLLMNLEDSDYNKYLNSLSQYNTDRSLAFNQYLQELENQQWQQNFDYQTLRDQLSDARTDSSTTYSQDLLRAQTLAEYGDFSGYKALGFTDDQIANMKSQYDAAQLLMQQQTASQSAANQTGYVNLSDAGESEPDYGGLYRAALAAQNSGGSAQNYISSNYKKYGFTSSSGLYSGYETWVKTIPSGDFSELDYDEDEGVFTWGGKTYADSPGKPGSGIDSLISDLNASHLTDAQWEKIKRRLEQYGFDVETS